MKKTLLCVALGLLLALSACNPKQNHESGFVVHSEGWTPPASEETDTEETESLLPSDNESPSETPSESETEKPTEPPTVRQDCSDLITDSDAFCVVDDTGAIYMGKNEQAAFAPASITKVMTALVAAERVSPDNMAVVSEEALRQIDIMSSGVTPSFKPGEEVSIRDLIYALLLPSTNSAGNILAENVAGDIGYFVQLMNEKAAALGCVNTHFMNPHGLDREGHYVCAYDMALILRAAVANPLVREALSARSHTIPATKYTAARTMAQGHKMVSQEYYVEGVFAGKVGSTVNAEKTMVTAVERQGKRFYICTLHSGDGNRDTDTDNIIRYAYARYFGQKTVLLPIAYEFNMVASGPTGADFTFKTGNSPVSARVVFWNLRQGPAGAQYVNNVPVAADGKMHLAFPEYGSYRVQLYVKNARGDETVSQSNFLHSGTIHTPGVQTWNGQAYLVDPGEKVGVECTEMTGAAFYADQCGCLVKNTRVGRFYAGPEYKLISGWVQDSGSTYYYQTDGRMATGDFMIDGVLYHFTNDGRLIQ